MQLAWVGNPSYKDDGVEGGYVESCWTMMDEQNWTQNKVWPESKQQSAGFAYFVILLVT